jgi:hypothetical protein
LIEEAIFANRFTKGSHVTKIGRNDSCHCGSGKKYKKCCMKKDKEAAQTRQEVEQTGQLSGLTPPQRPPEPPDPQQEAIDAIWDKFQTANYEGQIALFHKTLEEGAELIDGEMAFEFLNTIYYKSVERNERDRFEALAEALGEQLPDVYAAEAGYISGWRITNAVADGRFDDIPAMANQMAQAAEKNIDQFFNLMDLLAYHNQLATLISATTIAWPQVKDSTTILGIDEFANQATDYIVFNYLTQTTTPDSNDPTLLAQIAPYMDLNLDLFSEYIAGLANQGKHTWTMDDFEFDPPESDTSFGWDDEDEEETVDEGRRNLHQLTVEFLGYLYHQEDIPYAKGALARAEIYEYILRRYDGELEPHEPMIKPKGGRKRKSGPRQPQHPLCPDRNTFDHFLADLLHFINPQYYKAATTLELVPAWLHFLESRQLIDAEQREQTLFELRGLDTEFLKAIKDYPDPTLQVAMENWRNNAEQKQMGGD